MSLKPECILDAQASLGEGPAWHEHDQVLYWVDIEGHRLHRLDPATGRNQSFELGRQVGAAVPRECGGLVLAMRDGFHGYDPETNRWEALTDPEPDRTDNRFNDGKCDRLGRFWAGTMSMTGQAKAGSLYRLDPDGSIRTMLQEVSISNGLAWNEKEDTFYYIDSPTKVVRAFDYDEASGSIDSGRDIVRIPEGEGVPDGMTIDAEGNLWVAQWGGWKVSVWDPARQSKVEEIPIPAAQVTSCTFGGPDLKDLYITTARIGLAEADRAGQPRAGGIFHVRVPVAGAPTYSFRG